MRPLVPVLGVLVLLLAAQGAAAWSRDIAQGEVHTFWNGTLCLRGPDVLRYTLVLLDPSPGDRVALVVENLPVLLGAYTPGIAVASYEEPRSEAVSVRVYGCGPSLFVVGLTVDGATPYTIECGPC